MAVRLKQFVQIPPEIKKDFWEDTLRKNRLSLLAICIMILGMETFNIFRVLVWSESGLGTLNNRIYFTMYLLLWIVAAVYLVLWRLLRRSSLRVRRVIQYGTAFFALFWHAGINAYDLMRNPAAETTIFITAMLGLAVFIQMPVIHSLASYGLSYCAFMALAGGALGSGRIINITFTSIVALAVSITSFRHAVVTVSQRREIDMMNRRLQEQVQKDPLTGLMNAAAFRSMVESRLTSVDDGSEAFLIILDLDDFKSINDVFGHPCGDYVLKETAVKLQALFPDASGAARIGGDEFMLALSGISRQEVEENFRRLLLLLGQLSWRGQSLSVSCSMGACRVSQPGITYDRLYGAADHALYSAKNSGKGRFICTELSQVS